MKKTTLTKLIAAAFALCVSTAALSACGKGDTDEETTTASETETVSSEEFTYETAGTMRAVAEGDVFAINKFTVDTLPENYELTVKSQQDGAQYMRYILDGGLAQISIEAANYKEDYQGLDVFAENACAAMKINNLYYACDTEFSEPTETTVAGFDAIYYDYTITQNEFEYDDEGNAIKDDDGRDVRHAVAWYTGRAYFFYSDNDVFYFICETTQDNWDEYKDLFEQFASSVSIDESAENESDTEDDAEEAETVAAGE